MTEISADSLSATCQTLPRPGSAKRSTCGIDDAAEHQRRFMPTLTAASSSPRDDREIRGAKHLGLIRAGNDADRERAGGERRTPTKPS